jgi:DnaJ like chaperone protein
MAQDLDTAPSLWSRIADALAALAAGEPFASVFDRLRGAPDPERSVGFTIAVIALGAKMAKADGTVTRAEVTAFRRVFTIAPDEEANAARVFDLAREDVAGFDAYARRIVRMFRDKDHPDTRELFIDLIECLFHIALADDILHDGEEAFLAHVAEIFGLDDRCYRTIRARLVEGGSRDPYDLLGVSHDASLADIRAAWRRAVKENHPDAMIARGVPPEAVRLSERRLIAINAAWEDLRQRHAA